MAGEPTAGDSSRKVKTTDFIALKAKVKAEMLRRAYSGSVASYGGTGYDFTVVPTDNGPILGEHLKKNLEPMQAINGDGLPTYPGGLTKGGHENMEAKVGAWAVRSITDTSASDCKTGCAGTCYGSCQTGCYTGCSSCSGCDGCSGCGSGCATGCSTGCNTRCDGCGNDCSTKCNWACGACDGSCAGNCYENGTF